jgi:DNA-binding MarR family transcriptional regulator
MKDTERQLEILMDIRELLRLIAEPQLAERDRKWRDELRKIAGKGEKNIKAVLLMDGARNQSAIAKEIPMDVGQLSKLVKSLRGANLLTDNENPEVVIPVSESIFQER